MDFGKFPEEAFTIHGSFRSKPGRGEELENSLRKLVRSAEAEPGVLIFQIARDLEDRDLFLIFERYAGRAAFQSHTETKEFQELLQSGIVDGALEPKIFNALKPL